MSRDPGTLRDIWGALSLITRRLDELTAHLARLGPAGGPAAAPVGETLDEADRDRLADLQSLLALGPPLPRDEAWLLAVDRLVHRAGAECAAVFVPTPAGDLEAVAARGFAPGTPRVGAGEGIVGRALVERETIRATPAHQLADRLLAEHALAHALAVPIGVPGQPALGVLFAGRRRAAAFGPGALETMALVADRLASPSRGVAPGPATPERIVELGADLDLVATATSVARLAARRLGAPRVAVLLPEEGRLTLIAGVGIPPGTTPPDAGTGAVATVLQTAEAWVGGEEPGDDALAGFLGAPARLLTPLSLHNRLIALIAAGGPHAVAPTALADLLGPAAHALRNARLYAETVAAVAELRGSARVPQPPPPPPVRDFANLLAVVLARIALVRERVTDTTLGRELGVAEEAAWRAAEAVRSFLGFAPGHRAGLVVPLDLGSVIRSAADVAQRRWRGAGRTASVALDLEPIPPVRGNPDDLREAIDRLLENAAEAGPNGSVISVRARWDGGRRVEVTVEDAGPGMEEAVRARALEPFFSTRGQGRLGLGLPVAQAIVARHQGVLDLVSVPGQGTTVRLWFPTAVVGARPGATGGEAEPTPARVLVVEDEAHVREALVALLRQQGHLALAATDGREGIAIVEREPVDVVFTDLAVPGHSGLEVARAVKRLRPGTPVVLITAWPGRLDATVLQQSGIDRVIEKPVGTPEVLASLDAALTLRRAPHS